MAEGIILAAGRARRAKTNKLMLTVDKSPLILHAVCGMRPFVTRIMVITGHYHEAISDAIKHLTGVQCVKNTEYDPGMFSSVRRGVFETREDFFVLPGDCPFVGPGTYKALLAACGLLRVPVLGNGRRGHPLFIKAALKPALLEAPEAETLKSFRDGHGFSEVLVDDDAILDDIDTTEGYLRIKGSRENQGSKRKA